MAPGESRNIQLCIIMLYYTVMGFASLFMRLIFPEFNLDRLVRATAPSQKRPIRLGSVVPIMMSWTHRLTGPSPSNSAHGIS